MKEKRDIIFPSISVMLMIYTLIFPIQCSFFITKALDTCLKNLIPSLFPFIFLVKFYFMIKKSNNSSLISKLVSKVTGISPALSGVILLGFFSGFPTGAIGASAIYEKGLCSKHDAQRAIAISNNCSAAFLINVVGAKALFNKNYGYILLISQCISIVISALLLRMMFPKPSLKSTCANFNYNINKINSNGCSFVNAFTQSIKSSIEAILNICAYVMFFSLLSGIICDSTGIIFNNCSITTIISGLFEVSGGVIMSMSLSFPRNIIICSFICSLSGLAVYFQVSDVCEKFQLSTVQFILSHFMCALISPIICCIILCLLPEIKGFKGSDIINLPTVFFIAFAVVAAKFIFNVKVNKIR